MKLPIILPVPVIAALATGSVKAVILTIVAGGLVLIAWPVCAAIGSRLSRWIDP